MCIANTAFQITDLVVLIDESQSLVHAVDLS